MPFWTPRRKNRKYQRFTVEELLSRLQGRTAEQIFADIEKHGDGHVIPLSLLGLISRDDGVIDKLGGVRRKVGTSTAADVTITVPAGERWEVLQIIGSYDCDATVADRAVRLAIYAALPSVAAGATLTWLAPAITLSANQDGQLYTGRSRMHFRNDNGSTGTDANFDICPVILDATSHIDLIATNEGAADSAGMYVYYRLRDTYAD